MTKKAYRYIDAQRIATTLRREGGGAVTGVEPKLKWLPISALVIDPEYQRDLLERGRRNILRIAKAFDWAKFSTVIVARVEDGLYAVVDGQHRTTAAAAVGIKSVPCQIIEADRGKQAEAFVSINSVVTGVSVLQIHAARVAAGDPDASELARVCARAGVSVCRYPVPANEMVVGQSLAASSLYRCLKRFGPKTLETALKCITKTGDGNVGMVRAQIIGAFCVVLNSEPKWAKDRSALLGALNAFDLRGAFRRARMGEQNIQTAMVVSIADHLSRAMKRAA